MRIGTNDNFVELRITETVPSHLPSAGDLVGEFFVKVNTFSGSGSFGFDVDEFEAFAEALRVFTTSLSGVVTLNDIAPEEMSLSLAMADTKGYAQVTFTCSKLFWHPWSHVTQTCSMSATFEVALTALAELIAWSEHLKVEPPSQ
jgi:hypothetical protein